MTMNNKNKNGLELARDYINKAGNKLFDSYAICQNRSDLSKALNALVDAATALDRVIAAQKGN